jgi:hypothetical protein
MVHLLIVCGEEIGRMVRAYMVVVVVVVAVAVAVAVAVLVAAAAAVAVVGSFPWEEGEGGLR